MSLYYCHLLMTQRKPEVKTSYSAESRTKKLEEHFGWKQTKIIIHMVNKMDIIWDGLMERRSSPREADDCDRSRGEEKTRRAYWSIWDPQKPHQSAKKKPEKHTACPLLACCFAQSCTLSVINNQTNQLRCLKLRLWPKPPTASVVFAKRILTGSAAASSPVLPELCPEVTAAALAIPHPAEAPREANEWRK